jgi:ferrous iron transport protein B
VTLFDAGLGEKITITKVKGRGAFRKRITEMGFIVGKEVTVIKKAPLQDPVEYSVLGYNVTLRNSEAKLIEVQPATENPPVTESGFTGTFQSERNRLIRCLRASRSM